MSQSESQPDASEPFSALELSQPSGASQASKPQTLKATRGNQQLRSSASASVRLADDRPEVNEARLTAIGISVYESRRLRLLSDLPVARVQHLPDLADALFAALEAHFGVLSPAVDESDFQVTGYLIADRDRFQQSGLMPAEEFTIKHGRHRHYEFWMFDQADDYYRRHLLLHEFTHCFMTCESGMTDIPALWYVEGMAEFFATHQIPSSAAATPAFGILPAQFSGFEGWGRISELRRHFGGDRDAVGFNDSTPDVQQLHVTTLEEATPEIIEYFSTGKDYSESWAVCWFLQNHPKYSKHFAPLRTLRRYREFTHQFSTLCSRVQPQLSVDWLLFQESLQEGFDVQHSWAEHARTRSAVGESTLQIAADRDWQDTGVILQAHQEVTVTNVGRCSVNDSPQPWISEPQGISIDYFRGQPLGRVVAVLVGEDGKYLSQRIAIGSRATFIAPQNSRLWLQINDSSASRKNNAGEFTTTIKIN